MKHCVFYAINFINARAGGTSDGMSFSKSHDWSGAWSENWPSKSLKCVFPVIHTES